MHFFGFTKGGVDRILHNLGLLPDPIFKTVQQLNHYRKALGRQIDASLAPDAMPKTI